MAKGCAISHPIILTKGDKIMKLNVDQTLKTLDGQVMKDVSTDGEAIDASLKLALVNALLAPKQEPDSGVVKIQKYELAKRIYIGGVVELTVEEVALCKKTIEDAFPSPLLVGQVVELLEGIGKET